MNNLKKTQNSTSQASEITIEETPSETAFKKEISELFDISKDQIPTSQKSIDFAPDLPVLDLTISEATAKEAFSFLDYLLDQKKI